MLIIEYHCVDKAIDRRNEGNASRYDAEDVPVAVRVNEKHTTESRRNDRMEVRNYRLRLRCRLWMDETLPEV